MPKSAHEVMRGVFDKAVNGALFSMNLEDNLEQYGITGIDVGGMRRQTGER
jgi:hypothetical protein